MLPRHLFTVTAFSALFSGLLTVQSVPAFASTGPQYLALRRQHKCDRKLTYAVVQNNPFAYSGRVIELRGRVGGRVESEGSMTVMLNLPDRNALNLDIPLSEARIVREFDTPDIRVLVKIGESSGNVAPMQVLAVAHESEVNVIERREMERMAAVARATEQRRKQQTASRATLGRRSSPTVASRGALPKGSTFGRTDIERQANYYVPYLQSRARHSVLREKAQPFFVAYFSFISRWNPRLSADETGSITYHLLHFADQHAVDPRLVVALIIAESDFRPNLTSSVGAQGLGQLMPGTARELGVNNSFDPIQNLYGSVRYLSDRLHSFADKGLPGGGLSFEQVSLALAAYNAGPGAVKKYKGVPPYRQTQAYVKKVTRLYQWLSQEG